MSDSDTVNPMKLSTRLEAILYLKAQPMGLQELADFALCEIEDVEEALLELMQDYALRESALEVVETDAGFSLQLREQYMSLVYMVVPTDLGVAALRTLAVVALKGPIAQTKLVEIRGSGAYQHVGDLIEQGFVGRRRMSNGRSYTVNVTEKFYQYFEVDELPKLKLKKTPSVSQGELDIEGAVDVPQSDPEVVNEENKETGEKVEGDSQDEPETLNASDGIQDTELTVPLEEVESEKSTDDVTASALSQDGGLTSGIEPGPVAESISGAH